MASKWRARASQIANDEALVGAWYQEHGAAILAFAIGLTGDRFAAEDVLQETLVRAWRHAGSLTTSAGSIRAWLFTVARNIVVDHARARASRPAEVAHTPELAPELRDHAQQVVDSITAIDALDRLSEEHRIVLEQLYIHDLSVAQAAEVLKIPPGTVKSRAHYALKALRDALAVATTLERGGSDGCPST
jgi:RNA polymerase sigma-70 factor (ECF subfamily)